jgi:polyisoprenoid-binding protein YceI
LFGNSVVTVGQTSDVAGRFQLSAQDGQPVIEMSELTVDLRTLASDNNIRDMAIRRQWLESDKYPTATFVATSVEGLPADAVQGQAYTFEVSGDLTIRDITNPATFQVTVTLNGSTLTGQGTAQVYMRDYGFEPPEILGRFTVSDPATITIQGIANLVEG